MTEPKIFALGKELFKEEMNFEDTHQVGRKDFEELGQNIGLNDKLIKRELNSFIKEKPITQALKTVLSYQKN